MINRNLSDNRLESKKDLENAFLEMMSPYLDKLSPGCALVDPGTGAATFSERAAQNEGFSRLLWGAVPYIKGTENRKKADELAGIILKGIAGGTNSENDEFWGVPSDYDQLLVEMAAFAYALLMAPEIVWEPLGSSEKKNFARWLLYINEKEIPDCNWIFFRILVNCALVKIGVIEIPEILYDSLKLADKFFLDDNGWYNDGYPDKRRARDYYIPWAMHFYGLVFSAFCSDIFPEYSKKYTARALKFSLDFEHWFDNDGKALPFGRSLTYRFAQAAFWGVLPLALSEGNGWEKISGIFKMNIRWWLKQPIFCGDGTMSVGYRYPNQYMAERYNSSNSPLWAFKAMAPLAVSGEHPFWKAETKKPGHRENQLQISSGMYIFHSENAGHHYALNAGQWTPGISNEHLHMAEKYSKFAYSSFFGFNVVTDAYGIDKLACDNMLLLTDDEQSGFYRFRKESRNHKINEDYLYSEWKPFKDVNVETWLMPLDEVRWHIRVHLINSDRKLYSAEGGFPVPFGNNYYPVPDQEDTTKENRADAAAEDGRSIIICMKGKRRGYIIPSSPNANIMHPRTVIPVLKGEHQPGETLLICAVYGDPDSSSEFKEPELNALINRLPEKLMKKIMG